MAQPNPKKPLTILVATCIETGHLNACIGEMLPFKHRGHRVIFVLHRLFSGKLAALGFEEHLYPAAVEGEPEPKPLPRSTSANPAQDLLDVQLIGPYTPAQKLQGMVTVLDSPEMLSEVALTDAALKVAIGQYRPDAIVVDAHALPPAVYYSGVPWIRSCSMGPTMEVWLDEVPPGGSGFSQHSDRTQWPAFNAIRRPLFFDSQVYRRFVVGLGYAPYPDDVKFPPTQILTVYACPEELNYPQVRDSGWFNLEAFNKVDASGVEAKLEDLVPKEFLEDTLAGSWSGKYVYFSMGSIVANDTALLKRLVEVLARTNHKYIVSKGKSAKNFVLPKNMWGEAFLKQTQLLASVDLVLTHCGNNSFTETFARGVPMVALPVFADQLDNAQRLVDCGLGIRLDPYNFQDADLLAAVEKVMYDSTIRSRMQAASKRIQASTKHEELADRIEELLAKEK